MRCAGAGCVARVVSARMVSPRRRTAQTPPYITAKPDAAARAFGGEVAGQDFFQRLHAGAPAGGACARRKSIPGFDCPADPQIALAEVIPYPVKPGAVSWIERYVVACTPRTMRNFLLILEGDAAARHRNAARAPPTPIRCCSATRSRAATPRVAAVRPKDCDKPIVTDTRLTVQAGARRALDRALDLRSVRHQGRGRDDVHAVRRRAARPGAPRWSSDAARCRPG